MITLLHRAYALACLVASATCYWPIAMFFDSASGFWLAARLHPKQPFNPQRNADGPEFLLGSPSRSLWLFDTTKPGHRGFLRSLAGPYVGGALQWLHSLVWSGLKFAAPFARRSEHDHSTSDDTLVLTGVVRDLVTGSPIPDAKLWAWQADPRGDVAKYGDLDLDFDFRGRYAAQRTTGRYVVGTLYPVTITARSASFVYVLNAVAGFIPSAILWAWSRLTGAPLPGLFRRPPHVHFYVSAPGYYTLCTQLYFADRLAPGEFTAMIQADPAHGNPAMPLNQELLLHPTLRADVTDPILNKVLPREARWAAAFDFTLDRVVK